MSNVFSGLAGASFFALLMAAAVGCSSSPGDGNASPSGGNAGSVNGSGGAGAGDGAGSPSASGGGFISGGNSAGGDGAIGGSGEGANAGASSGGGGGSASGGGGSASGGVSSSGGTGGSPMGGAAGSGGNGGGVTAGCATDSSLPKEPVDPPVCATLTATKSFPDESGLDTARIQSALNGCGAGKAVKLVSSGSNDAFVIGKLTISGSTLWVDSGTTLYASRNPSSYGCSAGTGAAENSCGSVINVTGANAGIIGQGMIDGQGGEPIVGQSQSWWDVSAALRSSNGSASNPALITVSNATNFVMHDIRIYNSPKFHVKLSSQGFIVWGVEVMSPSKPANSAGKALTPYGARNTDGIDPGAGNGATSDGYIVCSKISVGDDQIAIKGAHSKVSNLTIAHDHFGTGHGMSIGSETNAGVTNVNVYDLTIDGTLPTGGSPASDVNGIRIKSDASRGGLVDKISYANVCMRNLANPILLNPNYSSNSGSLIPQFTNITLKDIEVAGGGTVTLDGYDSAHATSATLDNVNFGGSPTVTASNAKITIAAGGISFAPPSGSGVTVTGSAGRPTPIDCSPRWVAFP